jgi:hypothetical protein
MLINLVDRCFTKKPVFTIATALLLFSSVTILQAIPAQACKMAATNPTPVAKRFKQTPQVFTGVVTKLKGDQIVVKVDRYFKGSGPSTVTIASFNDEPGSCSEQIRIDGKVYVFFAKATASGPWESVSDSYHGSAIRIYPKLLAQLRKLASG